MPPSLLALRDLRQGFCSAIALKRAFLSRGWPGRLCQGHLLWQQALSCCSGLVVYQCLNPNAAPQ